MTTFWDSETQINEPPYFEIARDISDDPAAVLPDGRIIVVWHSGGASSGDGDGSGFFVGVKGRIINTDGSPAGPEFVVNTTTTNQQSDASVTTLSDGRFVVTWTSQENGDGGPSLTSCIRARVFNADGTPASFNGSGSGASTNDFVVNTIAGGFQAGPDVAALPGGGFVVTYVTETALPGHLNDITMRVYDSVGATGPEQQITETGINHPEGPEVLALADGRFVIAYFVNVGTPVIFGGVHMRFFLASGAPDTSVNGGNAIPVDTTNVNNQHDVHLALLNDGRILATWVNEEGNPDGSGTEIRARVLFPDGTADTNVNGGLDFRVNTTTTNNQRLPNPIGLANGGFLITFSSDSGTPGGVLAREYDVNGVPQGNDFVIQQEPVGGTSISENALIRMPDGRVLAIYDEVQGTNAMLLGRFISSSVAGQSYTGTATGEQYGGGHLDDMLDGVGGDDYLAGGAGNDSLNGSEGNDTLSGGSGNDVMNGGTGNDTVSYWAAGAGVSVSLLVTVAQNTGGAGTDTVSAVEHVVGSRFNDVLTGNNGNNNLTGGAGNDTLLGNNGSDNLDGGGGGDSMGGGTGNDFYTVDSSDDVVTEGANGGFDTVYASLTTYVLQAEVERVYYTGTAAFVGIGNSGDNRIYGNAGDDRFVDVLGGNDIFSGGGGSDSIDFRSSATAAIINLATGAHGGAAAGDVYSSIEKFFGSNTQGDAMTAGTGRANFSGFGGNDTLTGGNNIDALQGNAGNDSLDGAGGIDNLDGGAGNDTMTGGTGNDYFVFSAAGFGQDVITDFADGFDRLKVHSSIANNISAFNITGNGSTNVLLTQISSPTNTITLQGASAITITAADFLFY